MKKLAKRLLSLLLCVTMVLGVAPTTAMAAEPFEVLDSGVPNGSEPEHWLQQYQEYVLSQMEGSPFGPRKARAAGSASASYSMISWASGTENRLTFANGAYLGDGMPKIKLGGEVAFCAEWNGTPPSGSYTPTGEGDDPEIKQILANYHNSGKSNADYAAAQAAIWAHIMGTSVDSWGDCPGASSEDEIFYGDCDYSDIRYNYINWAGGTQNLITYHVDEFTGTPPDDPPDDPPEKYRTEVTTDTSTSTEVRNKKTYEYSDAVGQITIRKHDQDEKSLDGALFDIGATRS